MLNLSEKLRKIRSKLGLSLEKIADELTKKGVKITARTIYAYETEERPPALPYVQALIDIFNINPKWLFSDIGKMFYTEKAKIEVPVDIDNIAFIPVFDMKKYNGKSLPKAKDYFMLPKSKIEELTTTEDKYLKGFTNSGITKEGITVENDIVIVDTKDNDLSTDGSYVVNMDKFLSVKILQRIPEYKVWVKNNPKSLPFTVDLHSKDFKILGKVIFRGGKLYKYD